MYLELTGVRKMYDEDNGVKQIDLAVEKGMLLTLLGPSGCGKTTLLNLLGGFLKPGMPEAFFWMDRRLLPVCRRNARYLQSFRVMLCFRT